MGHIADRDGTLVREILVNVTEWNKKGTCVALVKKQPGQLYSFNENSVETLSTSGKNRTESQTHPCKNINCIQASFTAVMALYKKKTFFSLFAQLLKLLYLLLEGRRENRTCSGLFFIMFKTLLGHLELKMSFREHSEQLMIHPTINRNA